MLRKEGNTNETTEARATVAESARLRSGIPREYPFEVTVPRALACPPSATERTHVGWFVRGVIDRKPRPDCTLEQELDIYGGPPGSGTAQRK